ncbi:MAG: YgiQ family radical SAM protein [Gammaproteobacteria bacterium]|nr:YgiQ family radical SAM protein [Gammaproteobacteria bacterium]
MRHSIPNLFSYRKYWAHRFGVASILPMSFAEMETLGWDSCDIILVTGDAYVDHPSFGMALIGRLLEDQGFRVGIMSQPDWRSAESFKVLGKPNLFFGVTAGNMDSMVNHYTADRKIRSDDAYTPGAEPNKRPDRATIVYAQRCREAYNDIPIVIGGIEASLRRVAHYDYWSDQIRRSVLLDSKADMLIYGNAERALVDLSHRLAKKEAIENIQNLRGTAVVKKRRDIEETQIHSIRLPSYEEVKNSPTLYAQASKFLHLESNPLNARALVQSHADRDVWINPPPIPLSTKELDYVYELPYSRVPHPLYENAPIPAYEMIKFSIPIMRGCFGGCSFCSITAHEGRIIQSRSESSILKEIEMIRDKTPGFTGIISDLGGPTANMYGLNCQKSQCQMACRKFSCLYPNICPNMSTNHTPLIQLYRKARTLPGIKKVLVASGVRCDLAIKSPEYIKELVTHHVGGYLKIAPEHICEGPLSKMMKPGIEIYERFQQLFDQYSKTATKEQYLIPYFIAAHPGTTNEDMLELALWLKKNNFRLNKVQTFLPTPMTLATTMYHTAKNPLTSLDQNNEKVFVPKKGKIRKLHKAFLRYHDPKNWPVLRQALKQMGREDLIGKGKRHLVPKSPV